eukprot:CAMPEP_0184874228 /NCGR_PEP_ID=MMETSP0580-20130426/42276_1 /TAXON_ID=1118495 /ORGANISM="Dactyliosolen fragilissimus" /LENGTH=608 /DNA_ID=CAMNT_0027377213 /DNA_START=5678 /DNA_END=7504 /DNA_ORIENTATION=+
MSLNIQPVKQQPRIRKFEEIENFGSWGFKDSGFVVKRKADGEAFVTMKGNRYEICGKQMTGLIPFLEEETRLKFDFRRVILPQAPECIQIDPGTFTPEDKVKILQVIQYDKDRLTSEDLCRIRHGSGHSQEEMFMIRSGNLTGVRFPDVVVYPKEELEIENLVYLASKEGWCIIPFGGGTNVSHATRCPSKEIDIRPIISLDMRLMNKIIFINEENCTAHVQAGITGSDLLLSLRNRGYTFGHEPDSMEFSTLGGWIATKSSGMKQNKYGNIEDIIKGIRAVSTNGMMWQNKNSENSAFGRVSTGIDLCALMLGSEGSFGIITSAVIKIWPLPEVKEYESIVLQSIDDGLHFVRDIAKMGKIKPASVRLLDNKQFRLGRSMSTSSSFLASVKNKFKALLLQKSTNSGSFHALVCCTICFEGTESETKLQKEQIKCLASKHGGVLAGAQVGESGYRLTFSIAYLRDFVMSHGYLAESFETFCNWSNITSLIYGTMDFIKKEHHRKLLPGVPIISFRVTQIYDEGACIYFYFCMNFTNIPNPSRTFSEIELAARNTILLLGGSLSHHHGIGKLRAQFLGNVNSKPFNKFLKDLKNSFDPENIFAVRNGVN